MKREVEIDECEASQMSDKPREGWLDLMCDGTDSNGAELVQCDLYFESQGDSKHVHVIEYSAYEAIAKERDYLREFNEPRMKDLRVSFDRVEKERDQARGLLKDHEDDWKRIQDAERALDEALAQSEFSNKHWTKMFDEERQKSAKLVDALLEVAECPCPADHSAETLWIDGAKARLTKALAAHNSQTMNHDSKYANNSAGPTGYTVDARGERIPDSEHPMRSATEAMEAHIEITQTCKKCGTKWHTYEPMPCPTCFTTESTKEEK